MPRSLAVCAEQLNEARGQPAQVKRVFERSSVPIVIVDGDRRYLDANRAAQSALALSLDELRRLRLDDLTPPHLLPAMESIWARLMDTGRVEPAQAGDAPRTYLGVTYYALANALPGQHLIAFAPGGWPDQRSPGAPDPASSERGSQLTPREVEVLKLASEGNSRVMIARTLLVSPATVRTHLEHIYGKLGVHDRAAAVARAMRLGLIT